MNRKTRREIARKDMMTIRWSGLSKYRTKNVYPFKMDIKREVKDVYFRHETNWEQFVDHAWQIGK